MNDKDQYTENTRESSCSHEGAMKARGSFLPQKQSISKRSASAVLAGPLSQEHEERPGLFSRMLTFSSLVVTATKKTLHSVVGKYHETAHRLAKPSKPESIDMGEDKDETEGSQTVATQENNQAFMGLFSAEKVKRMTQNSTAMTDILVRHITKGKIHNQSTTDIVKAFHKGCDKIREELIAHATHMRDFMDKRAIDAIPKNLFQGHSDDLKSLNYDGFLNFFNRNEYRAPWHTYQNRMKKLQLVEDRLEAQTLISRMEEVKPMFQCPEKLLLVAKQYLEGLSPAIANNESLTTALSICAFAMYASLVTDKGSPNEWTADAAKFLPK